MGISIPIDIFNGLMGVTHLQNFCSNWNSHFICFMKVRLGKDLLISSQNFDSEKKKKMKHHTSKTQSYLAC